MNSQDSEWIKKHMNIIYLYLVKNGANSEDAKDIVQETFYKALLYADSISSNNLTAWLFKVAINAYYDLCRKQNKLAKLSFDLDYQTSKNLLPEEELILKECHQEIQQVLNQLSPTYKALLVMKYEKEMSYLNMGNSLGMKIEKVKTYLSRAKKQFFKYYRRYTDND